MANQQPSEGIDCNVYDAAICPGTEIKSSQLEPALNSTTPGRGNTLLHVAASVGNIALIREILQFNPQLVRATNAQGNTPLHLAAQRGCSRVVKVLLQQGNESGADVLNKLGETALFKAYESGDLDTVKMLLDAYPGGLSQMTGNRRTCLYVAIVKGNKDLVNHVLKSQDARELIKVRYTDGDTALHVATGKKYVHIIRQLIEFEPQLCYWVNDNQEPPLCMAAKLRHLEVVKELIKCRPTAVETPNIHGMNVLQVTAQVSQVRIVEYLNQKVCLSDIVNQGVEKSLYINNHIAVSCNQESGGNKAAHIVVNCNQGVEKPQIAINYSPSKMDTMESGGKRAVHITVSFNQGAEMPQIAINYPRPKIEALESGDTLLHIAARKKNFRMVESLLQMQGINKDAVNEEGLTAVEIARENTEHHESHKIISKLANYAPKGRDFLYTALKVTSQKYENAINSVNKAYEDRRNTELVVAVLLATMSFTAAFTVPGGFQTEVRNGESMEMLGSPLLIGFESFQAFLIFDCLAFFLSLFVVFMWYLSTPLITGDKILFLCITNVIICFSFSLTELSFITAVYSMLVHKLNMLAWFLIGFFTIICGFGILLFIDWSVRFTVKMARFNHLHGMIPLVADRVVDFVWMKLERLGYFDWLHRRKIKWDSILYSKSYMKYRAKRECGSAENV
ncbi:hypothetical protein SUGI_0095830 [Cryptomeria japonica]|uniref:ankyrin repeat-containing protein At5g02620-like n=1 Tax=Cryptomeria japonica TaxID=3369 RepID=UPI002408ADD6|nr:ankyrin repeat-containing protein At5g02620-like [Cryptomeria japonica]GLJ08780.1 hypothetical protein SUGI_0095830 [Cryptomeria japonica]